MLTLTSESEIEAEAEGGDFEISFTLENPAEGGELKAESDEWITTDINDAAIDVTVAANEGEETREGIVTVTYTWAGEPLSFTVRVFQKKILGEAPFTIEIPEDDIRITSARVIYTYTGLEAETAYKAYAVGADYDGNITTNFRLKDFTTSGMTMTGLAFEIETTPQAESVLMDVYPSDKEAYYMNTVIDGSWYDAGYTDEEIMMEHIDYYWDYIIYYDMYYYQGDIKEHLIEGLHPETDYYAIAFGIDLDNQVYNSALTKVEFTTTAEQNGTYTADKTTGRAATESVLDLPDPDKEKGLQPLTATDIKKHAGKEDGMMKTMRKITNS